MEYIQVNNHIHLEAIMLSAAPVIFETIDRDRKYLSEWLPFVEFTRSVSDTELFIKSMIYQNGKKDEVFTIWYNLEFAGLIGFKDTDHVNRKTELGYWLAEKMQGKGIASTCVAALVKYAFRKLQINRIQIKVAKDNHKSTAIPVRLGFLLEGTEREGELLDSNFRDLEVYSLLKSDWISSMNRKNFP
jgi:ribosomal-protein-serine acetyltransferase